MKKTNKQSFDLNVSFDVEALAESLATKIAEAHLNDIADAITERIKENMGINADLEDELEIAKRQINHLEESNKQLQYTLKTTTKAKLETEDNYNKLVNNRALATNITRMQAMESQLSEARKEIARLVDERRKMEPLMAMVSDTIKRHVDTCVQHTENACRKHETNEVV